MARRQSHRTRTSELARSLPAGDPTPSIRSDAVAMRATLLDAAGDLIAAHGHDFGLPDLARHAGVGMATVYRHFDGVPDVVQQYHSRLIFDLTAALRDVETRSGPEELVRKMCACWVARVDQWGDAAVRIRPPEGLLNRALNGHPQSKELYITLEPVVRDLVGAMASEQLIEYGVLMWVTLLDERVVLELRRELKWSRRRVTSQLADAFLAVVRAYR